MRYWFWQLISVDALKHILVKTFCAVVHELVLFVKVLFRLRSFHGLVLIWLITAMNKRLDNIHYWRWHFGATVLINKTLAMLVQLLSYVVLCLLALKRIVLIHYDRLG